ALPISISVTHHHLNVLLLDFVVLASNITRITGSLLIRRLSTIASRSATANGPRYGSQSALLLQHILSLFLNHLFKSLNLRGRVTVILPKLLGRNTQPLAKLNQSIHANTLGPVFGIIPNRFSIPRISSPITLYRESQPDSRLPRLTKMKHPLARLSNKASFSRLDRLTRRSLPTINKEIVRGNPADRTNMLTQHIDEIHIVT